MKNNYGPTDFGPEPVVINLAAACAKNPFYRVALWTGSYLQTTIMTIPVGGDIGLEMHSDTDQMIGIESGFALVKMGACRDKLNIVQRADNNCAVFVPAGTWHNIINTGNMPLRLFSVYSPPHHPAGTVHKTKKDAQH